MTLHNMHSEVGVRLTTANISFRTNSGLNKKLYVINIDLCLAPELLAHCELQEKVR